MAIGDVGYGFDYSGVNDPEYNRYYEQVTSVAEPLEPLLPYTEWKMQQDRQQLQSAYQADPIGFWVQNGNYAPPDAVPSRIINDYRGEPVAFLDAQDRIIKWRPTYDTNDWKDVTDLGEPQGYTFPGFQQAPISGSILMPSGRVPNMAVVSENPGMQGIAIQEKEGYQFPWKELVGTLSVPLTAALLPVAIPAFASATGLSTAVAGATLGAATGGAVGALTGGGRDALIGAIMGGIGGYMQGANLTPAEAAQAFPVETQRAIEAMPLEGLEKINNVVSAGNVDLSKIAGNDVFEAMARVASQTGGLSDAGAAALMGSETLTPSMFSRAEMQALSGIKNSLTGSTLDAYNYTFANTPARDRTFFESITDAFTGGDGGVVGDIATGVVGAGILGGAELLGGGQNVPEGSQGLTPEELQAQVDAMGSAMGDYLAQAQAAGTGGTTGGVPITGAATPLFPQFTLPTEGPFYGAGRFGEPGQFTNFYAGQQAGGGAGGTTVGPYGVQQFTPPTPTFQPQAPDPTQTTIPGTNIQINPDLLNPPISTPDMMYTPDPTGQLYYEQGSLGELFDRLLQRAPTADELAWANDAMARGATAADIGQAIRSSEGYRSQTFLERSNAGQPTAPDTDWRYLLQGNEAGRGIRINEVQAGQVSNILKGVLGNVQPSLDLVYDIWSRIPSSARDWDDLVSNVQQAYNNSEFRAGTQTPSQQRYGEFAQALQQNPDLSIGGVQQFFADQTGAQLAPTQPLTSIQIGSSDQAYQFIPQEVRDAYLTYLDRPIGSAGAEWVSGAIREGGAINDIIQAIQNSPEAQAFAQRSPANTGYVAQQQLPSSSLGAPITASPATVTPAITAPTAPAINVPTNVAQAFQAALGRPIANDPGALDWVNTVVSGGGDINALINSIQTSPEALGRR